MTTSEYASRALLAGAIAGGVGLGVDVWWHSREPALDVRHELPAIAAAAHVLLVLAAAAAATGLALVVLQRWPRRSPLSSSTSPRSVLAVAGALLAVVVVGATVAVPRLTLAGTRQPGHDAVGTGGAPARPHLAPALAAPDADAPSALAPATLGAGAHEHGERASKLAAGVQLDAASQQRLGAQLDAARGAALRHPTVADALVAGYRMVTHYLPGMGAHYMKLSEIDGVFDVERPEMILYDGTDAGSRVVGLSYYLLSATEPQGFVGGGDHWHRHLGLCLDKDTLVMLGDGSTSEEECRRRGGFKADGRDGWMLHAWVVPGGESTVGVFSSENPRLR